MHQVRPQRPLQRPQLIEKYGRKANMMKWKEQLNGDCPRRDARSLHERCDFVMSRSAEGFMKNSSA
jgi:hypothetical protein